MTKIMKLIISNNRTNTTHINSEPITHTIYSMDETGFHCNEEYQSQHYSPRAFAQSPCNCSNNQYFGLFLHCD